REVARIVQRRSPSRQQRIFGKRERLAHTHTRLPVGSRACRQAAALIRATPRTGSEDSMTVRVDDPSAQVLKCTCLLITSRALSWPTRKCEQTGRPSRPEGRTTTKAQVTDLGLRSSDG